MRTQTECFTIFPEFGKFNYVLIGTTGIALAAVLIEMIGISFVLPVSECDLTLTSRDKGVLSGVGFVGKATICSHVYLLGKYI